MTTGRFLPFLLPALSLLIPVPAQADVTARYHVGSTVPVIVQVNDAGQARINMGAQAAIIVRDGTAYMLMADLQGPYAIRYDVLMSALDEATRTLLHREARQPLPTDPEYEAVELGAATEAGYAGTAWTIIQRGESGRPAPFELVVSTDPVLAPVGRVLARLSANTSSGFAPPWSTPSFDHNFVTAMNSVFERGTIIRFGRMMRLESASTDPIASSTFELPGEPLSREQFLARTGLPRITPVPEALPRPTTPAALPQPHSDGRGGTRARANLASYVSDADYPPEAIIQGEEGLVAFRLDVEPDGSVKRCEITSSSGSAALDEATCRIMIERPRFVPARDYRGRAVRDRVSSRMRWVLPMAWPGDPSEGDAAEESPGQ
jgi:TonB family protein